MAAPLRGRVRTRDWERLSHGLYLPHVPTPTLREELAGWSLVLPPTAAFTHLTAAELRGWWLPAAPPHPVFAAMGAQYPRPRRAGLLVCRHPQPVALNSHDGLRVTTAAETLLAAARDLGLLDLVLMADSALRAGHVSIGELKIAAGRRRRGAPLLRRVLPLVDARSESPWESIMRTLHRAAEIPVEPQREIRDASGRFLARADLWIVGTRRLHEYDGALHRDPDTHEYDLARDRALLGDGWIRYGYTSTHLLREGASIIRDADALLDRTWDPGRLIEWERRLDESMLRRPGRTRALQHWRTALVRQESGR